MPGKYLEMVQDDLFSKCLRESDTLWFKLLDKSAFLMLRLVDSIMLDFNL